MSRRLHPLWGLIRALRYGFLGFSVPFPVVGVALSMNLTESVGPLFALAPIGGGLGLAYGIARYLRFEFDLADEEVVVSSGVIGRRRREIPYDRIQSVDVRRDPVKRLLGLAVVRIETAGGSGSEATLDAVSAATADEIRETVARRRGESPGRETVDEVPDAGESPDRETDDDGATGTGEPAADRRDAAATGAGERGTVLTALSPPEAVLAAVASFRWGFLLLVPGVLFGYADAAADLFRFVYGPLGVSVPPPTLATLRSVPPGRALALLAVAVPAWVAAAYLASAAYSLNRYWGHTLVRDGDELRYRHGLLTERSGTVPLRKVQVVTVRENVLLRTLGRARVRLRTAGGGSGSGNGQGGGEVTVVPLADRAFALELARGVAGDFDDRDFDRPPERARGRYLRRYLIAGGAVVAGLAAWGASLPHLAGIGIVAVAVSPLAARRKWRHRGYYLGDDHLVARSGFWNRTTWIVPYGRIQTVATSRTVFQRRYGLGTVVADAAGGGRGSGNPTAPDLDGETADEVHAALETRLREAASEVNRR